MQEVNIIEPLCDKIGAFCLEEQKRGGKKCKGCPKHLKRRTKRRRRAKDAEAVL